MSYEGPLSQAKWIWPDSVPYVQNTYVHYRRDFELKRVPRKAPFHITADQSYMLYINGRYVGRGPARGYQQSWPFDSYDIAGYLNAGHNWISVRHYSGGISTFGYNFQWRSGLLCAASWRGFDLVSDEQWLSRPSTAVRADAKRVSVQLNLQEQVDARHDDQRWIRDAKPPRGWNCKTTAIPFGSMPWHTVEPREVPNLSDTMLAYERTCAQATGPCAPGYDDTSDATAPLRVESPKATWTNADCGKIADGAFAVTVPASGQGKFTAITIDLGNLSVGTLLADIRGADGGEIVDFHYTELLNDDGSPFLPGSISMVSRLVLRRGRTQHEFFQMMGHRYVTIVTRDSVKPLRVRLSLRETIYPLKIAGRFESSDPTLNDIHRICTRTQQVCALDSYVDTPWREQAQWWGDARVQAANTFHLSNDPALLARGVRSIARQEVPNGLTYGHAPTNCHAAVLPDFSITWALSIWDHYWQTGSADLFVEQWPRIQRMLGYFRGEGRGDNGLLRYDRRYWLFLDWSTLPKEETPTLLNMWYLYMLDKLAHLADLAGMAEDAMKLRREHQACKRLINRLLWDEKAGLFCDGLDKAGTPLQAWSIHSQTAAIMCGLRPRTHTTLIAKRLAPYLQGEELTDAVPSSFWVNYVYEAMTLAGHGGDVVEHIRRNYAPMIPYGGAWEIFTWAPGRGSVSHAWSAHPVKHLAGTLGGIVQTDAGWQSIRFAPVLTDPAVDRCDLAVPTPHGLIRSRWRRSADSVDVSLTLPDGIEAKVVLAGKAQAATTGQNRWRVKLA